MEEVEIKIWEPHPNQQKIVNDKKRFKIARCGRRFGKTVLAVSTLIEEALLKDDSLLFYVAPTYRQGKDIAWDMLVKKVRSLPKELVHKINESELYVLIGNGSKICIKGADNPDSLRGVGLNGVVLDEYADIKENVWSEIIEPALMDKKGWALIIGTPRGFNHFYTFYTKNASNPDWGVYHFTSYDNPLNDPAEIDRIRLTKTDETFEQEYLAEFRRSEGLVYKEFNREKHVYQELPEGFQSIEVIAGVDWGFNNPSVILVIKKDFDNVYWVDEEFYETKKTQPEIIEKAKALESKHKINAFYPDNAETDRIEEMKRAGLTIREIDKSDMAAGIDKVRSLFVANRLRIKANLFNTLFELEAYSYPKAQEGRNEKEEPIKKHDHAMDALRYALFTNEPTDKRTLGEEFGLYRIQSFN